MQVSSYRDENPEEWAELVSLFTGELTDNPESFIQWAALEMLELRSGETVHSVLKNIEGIKQ